MAPDHDLAHSGKRGGNGIVNCFITLLLLLLCVDSETRDTYLCLIPSSLYKEKDMKDGMLRCLLGESCCFIVLEILMYVERYQSI